MEFLKLKFKLASHKLPFQSKQLAVSHQSSNKAMDHASVIKLKLKDLNGILIHHMVSIKTSNVVQVFMQLLPIKVK